MTKIRIGDYQERPKILIYIEKYSVELSGYNAEDTPVPIPNTEVKLRSADDTWWAAAWESRKSLG